MNPIEQIFDENNTDPIVLYNENNEPTAFDQIAVIPVEDAPYVILKPVEDMEGVAEDEALVFAIREEDGEDMLLLEEDPQIIEEVFRQYRELLEEL